METEQILQALPHLSIEDRLKIAHAAFELVQHERSLTQEEQSQKLAVSALELLEEYTSNPEMAIFTTLDDEDFYEYTNDDLDNLDRHA